MVPVFCQTELAVAAVDYATVGKSEVLDYLSGIKSLMACHSDIIEIQRVNATIAIMKLQKLMSLGICLVCLLSTPVLTGETGLKGKWELDEELTEKLEPPIRTNRGFGRGLRNAVIPVPTGPGSQDPNAASLKQPLVLTCVGLTLSKQDETVEIACENGSQREFKVGNRHGRKTTWRNNRLTESYKSTSRRVKHSFKLDRNDNMIVTVTIKPDGGVSQKYVRAFNRVITESTPGSESPDSTGTS